MIAYKISASVMDWRAFEDYVKYCEEELALMVLPIDSVSAYLVIEDNEQLEEIQDFTICEIDYERIKEV